MRLGTRNLTSSDFFWEVDAQLLIMSWNSNYVHNINFDRLYDLVILLVLL